jgi:hypothetical protein
MAHVGQEVAFGGGGDFGGFFGVFEFVDGGALAFVLFLDEVEGVVELELEAVKVVVAAGGEAVAEDTAFDGFEFFGESA